MIDGAAATGWSVGDVVALAVVLVTGLAIGLTLLGWACWAERRPRGRRRNP